MYYAEELKLVLQLVMFLHFIQVQVSLQIVC